MPERSPDAAARSRTDDTRLELVGDRELVITRTFDAPRALVFEAWTTPEHVRRWWAPASLGMQMTACEIDLRVGGRYRFAARGPDGVECGFGGEYREVVPPQRIVHTEAFDGAPDSPALVTVLFEERGGRTRVTSRSVFPSEEIRAAAVASGMEEGVRDCMRQMDRLLASLLERA